MSHVIVIEVIQGPRGPGPGRLRAQVADIGFTILYIPGANLYKTVRINKCLGRNTYVSSFSVDAKNKIMSEQGRENKRTRGFKHSRAGATAVRIIDRHSGFYNQR